MKHLPCRECRQCLSATCFESVFVPQHAGLEQVPGMAQVNTPGVLKNLTDFCLFFLYGFNRE